MAAAHPLRDLLIRHIVTGVEPALKSFEAKTGRFISSPGRWVFDNQDVMYALAVLYTAPLPGNRYFGSQRILNSAMAAGDALRACQDRSGQMEWVMPGGGSWGKSYPPWSMFHWLETYALLKEHLPAARRRRWEEGLRLGFAGLCRQERNNYYLIDNIPLWNSMALVRAGQLFGQAEWLRVGSRNCLTVARAMNPDGWWEEGQGPTTRYNLVYVHALGLYFHFTGDKRVLPMIARATDFHRHFTYPDGNTVETVDGRVLYRENLTPTGMAGFVVTPEGRGLAQLIVRNMIRARPYGECNPYLAAALAHLQEERSVPALQTQDNFCTLYPSAQTPRALVHKQGPWYLVLSGYLTPPKARAYNLTVRWYVDRHQMVSLWHRDYGLIVGGGNSKNQPQRGTFYAFNKNVCQHMADSARLKGGRKHGGADRLELDFGSTRCCLEVRLVNDRRVELRFSGAGAQDAKIVGNLVLHLEKGERARTPAGPAGPAGLAAAQGRIDPQSPLTFWRDYITRKVTPWFETDRFRVTLPKRSLFEWPVYPYNQYALNNAASPRDAVAVISTDLSHGQGGKRFVITLPKRRKAARRG